MGCWVAVGKRPGWETAEAFRANLSDSSKWRADPQTSIVTVIALADGRLIAECHAPKREQFEAWLQNSGWQVDSIEAVRHVARTGTIWTPK